MGKFVDLLEEPQLVPVVEACGRLVHDEGAGALGKGPGDDGELPFSPAYFRIGSVGEMKYGKPPKGVVSYFEVFFGIPEKEGFVGDPPHECYVHDRIGKGALVDLGYIGDLARKVF